MKRGVLQGIIVSVILTLTLGVVSFTEAVAGGERAEPGEFPHVVQLSPIQGGDVFCGGSILAPSVILTAGHCLVDLLESTSEYLILEVLWKNIFVTAGTVRKRQRRKLHEEQTRTVDRFVLHPEFNLAENDIALLFLKKPLIYNDKVQPVQLPPPNVIFPRGTLAGWGRTDWRNVSSAYLNKIELDLEVNEFWNEPLTEPESWNVTDMRLYAISEKGKGSCSGDSGSSLICQRFAAATLQNNTKSSLPPTICGIVTGSTNPVCGESAAINVLADVSQYLDWIQDTMEAEGFGNLTKPLSCSESEGFFDCGEFGLNGGRIKRLCILIEKKCDGVNNCENGRDENETICAANTTGTGDLEEKVAVWALVGVIFIILIGILIAISYWLWNHSRRRRPNLEMSEV